MLALAGQGEQQDMSLRGFFPPNMFHGSVLHPGLCIPVLTLRASLSSAGDFNLYFSFPAEAGKIDSLATDVPASTVGLFLFLQLRWRSTGDKRISAASLGGGGRRLCRAAPGEAGS